jgi:hypothetical protein
MSLWTPGGEVPVGRERPEPAPTPPPGGAAEMVGGPDLDDLSPQERAQAEAFIAEMAETQRQIAATPAAQLVANHVMGFYELAAIKLGQQPPMLADAQVAIDAMAAVMDAVGDQLGEDATPLRQALTNLQMAFVQLRNEAGEG